MFLLGLVIGILLGFFVGSLFYNMILDEIVEIYNEVKDYEKQKQDKD